MYSKEERQERRKAGGIPGSDTQSAGKGHKRRRGKAAEEEGYTRCISNCHRKLERRARVGKTGKAPSFGVIVVTKGSQRPGDVKLSAVLATPDDRFARPHGQHCVRVRAFTSVVPYFMHGLPLVPSTFSRPIAQSPSRFPSSP
jgi:hypothetical protein